MLIRPLERKDYDGWLPLWQENCLNQISEAVTDETWRRLNNPKEQVYGLGAFDGETLIGILHYVLHPTTGFIEPACYMQDLFVREDRRGQGIAKQLVWELNSIAKNENYARLYWFVDNGNESAVNLYKNLGIKLDFGLHMLPTHD